MSEIDRLTQELRRVAEITALAASLHDHPGCDWRCGRLATKTHQSPHGGFLCDVCAQEQAANAKLYNYPPYMWEDLRGAKRARRLEALLTRCDPMES